MDTRGKIMTVEAALIAVGDPQRLTVVTGTFDPVYAPHARRLRELRDGGTLLVLVTEGMNPIAPVRARAEVLAGLSSVDFVIPARSEEAEQILKQLAPQRVFREETADAERSRSLVAHVHSRQNAE